MKYLFAIILFIYKMFFLKYSKDQQTHTKTEALEEKKR